MNPALETRWAKLCKHVGLDGGAEWRDLSAAYADPARAYHNMDHIADCLLRFDEHEHGTYFPRGLICFLLRWKVECGTFPMNNFFQRGGVWVLVQNTLLAAVILMAAFFRGGGFHPVAVIAGATLLIIAAGVSLAGALALGKNLTPFPKPAGQAQLVRHGIYSMIRHPLYTSLMAAAIGWALVWQSWPALLVAALLIPFFIAKSRLEERWLRDQFPEYADYERQVRGFLPWR